MNLVVNIELSALVMVYYTCTFIPFEIVDLNNQLMFARLLCALSKIVAQKEITSQSD